MRETAEERRRLYALLQIEQMRDGSRWTSMCDDNGYEMVYYEQMLDDISIYLNMNDEVCDEPKVSLVKKYSKGSFKFV